jgi:hypothetical protein
VAVSVTVTAISIAGNGEVRIRFGKRERVFADLSALKGFVREVLTNQETLEAAALALMIARQPNLANPAAFVGHAVNVDFTAANWGTIT